MLGPAVQGFGLRPAGMGESGEWAEGGLSNRWFSSRSGSILSLVAFWIWAVLLLPKLLADLPSASFRRHPKGCAPLVVPAR